MLCPRCCVCLWLLYDFRLKTNALYILFIVAHSQTQGLGNLITGHNPSSASLFWLIESYWMTMRLSNQTKLLVEPFSNPTVIPTCSAIGIDNNNNIASHFTGFSFPGWGIWWHQEDKVRVATQSVTLKSQSRHLKHWHWNLITIMVFVVLSQGI